MNINRQFRDRTGSPEVRLIRPLLERYDFAMDLHEDWPVWKRPPNKKEEPEGNAPEEFYLWEFCKDKSRRVGGKIVDKVERAGIEVCKNEIIYGDKNNGGVIWYPEDCGTACYAAGTSFDWFLIDKKHTKQSFVIETIRDWSIEKRVLAHIIALKTALGSLGTRSS